MADQPLICHLCGFTPTTKTYRCPHDGAYLISPREHAKDPRDPYLGRVLGEKYPILGIIGLGGMGAVYRSQQLAVRRHVAIKVIAPLEGEEGTRRAEELKARFMREARVIAELDHPKVVTLHDFGAQADGALYMVMEYVDGKPLSHAMIKMPLRRLVEVIVELLEVLEVAHSKGLIHRDIKPDNIMVLRDRDGAPGGVKLLDFGIAKRISGVDSARLTQEGTRLGTPHYMSPEQARGLVDVDGRSDLYSAGVILYKAVAGRLPFDDTDPIQLIIKVAGVEPPPLPRRPGLPEGLLAIIERALSKQPEERFSDARAMRLALEEIQWQFEAEAETCSSGEVELAPTVLTEEALSEAPTTVAPAPETLTRSAAAQTVRSSVEAEARSPARRWWIAVAVGIAVGVGIAAGWMGM